MVIGITALLLSFGSSSFSQSQQNTEKKDLAKNLLDVSGLEQHAELIPISMLSEINSLCEQVGLEPFDDVFMTHASDSIKTQFAESFYENLSISQLRKLIVWFNSDLGKKLSE